MDKQKIIIQSFGLEALKIGVYVGSVAAIEAGSRLEKSSLKNYDGLFPNPKTPDNTIGTSVLGTPLFDNLVISPGTYTDSIFGIQNYQEIRLDSCLITLYQQNNVVLTPIQGRDGEVIEYISKMSFRINIKGGIFGTGNQRPVNDIAEFKKMIQSNLPINIGRSGLLNEWDISEIVVLDKNIPQSMGGYNYQLFEVNAIQNTSVILASKSA